MHLSIHVNEKLNKIEEWWVEGERRGTGVVSCVMEED